MAALLELGPRQRMINMMYIIFIAMLALNMSKEVLEAFGDVNNNLKSNIEQTGKQNQALMAGLADRAKEQPEKYEELHNKAVEIQELGDELVDYIDAIKDELEADIERDENGELKYKNMDRDTQINEMFFANDKLTDKAKTFVTKIDQFREKAIEATSDPKVQSSIEEKLSTAPVKTADGAKEHWMNYNFEGFPLVAGITKMTNIQANAKQIEADLLSGMVSGQMESDISMTNYKAMVIPDKNAFFSDENFTGKIVLGRYDETLDFDKVTINGKNIEDTEAGQVNLDFSAGDEGDHDIEGELQFKENDSVVKIPVESSYMVIPKPNSAVISADKMNVVYRGVKNPLTISIPGVSKVSANAAGMTHQGGSDYVMEPTQIKGREVEIKASGELSNGETVSDSKTFRVKDIPPPNGTVRGETGSGGPVKMQKNGLAKSTVGAEIPDFDFDVNLKISGFKLQVPGKPVVQVNGQKLNSKAKSAVKGAKRGETVQIFDIQAQLAGASGYRLKKVTPVVVKLTN